MKSITGSTGNVAEVVERGAARCGRTPHSTRLGTRRCARLGAGLCTVRMARLGAVRITRLERVGLSLTGFVLATFVLATFVLAGLVLAGRGRSVDAAEFDAGKLSALRTRMQAFVDQKQLAGVVTVVGNEKGIASFEAVGMANIAQQRPMAPDTLFRIASMTKPITALAVMMLVDEGKVSVDAPVEKYLPEFTGQLLVASKADGVTTLKRPARPITVRDLMTHTSGLPGGFPAGVGDLYGRRHLSLAEAVLVSSQQPLDFEPGAKWAYCNAGIDALGRIVESLSGEPFEVFVERRIFKPLGMTDTFFYPPADRLPRVAAVYDAKDGQLVEPAKLLIGPTVGARHPIPAGGLYSTGGDLARLYQAMLAGGRLGDAKIVSAESLAAMTKVQTGDLACGFVPGMGFGFGWAVVRQPQDVTAMLSPGTYGHGGAFGTQGWIDPQRGYFVILLIQRVGLKNGDASEMRRELQRITVEAIKP